MTTFLEETIRLFGEKFPPFKNRAYTKDTADVIKDFIASRLTLQRKEMREMIEKMPTEFPERESDEYDNGYKKAKLDIINALDKE